MAITTEEIKVLRDSTGVSIMQCKKALEEALGDMDKARIILEKKSKAVADKKTDRELNAGVVASYVHSNGTVGSMVELLCETDFVGKNEDFKKIAYDIAMHIAAQSPLYLSVENVTEEEKSKAMEVFKEEVEGKPEEMKEKILAGKMDSYFGEKSLLSQDFIKNPEKKIKNLVEEAVQKFGENISVGRFVRFEI